MYLLQIDYFLQLLLAQLSMKSSSNHLWLLGEKPILSGKVELTETRGRLGLYKIIRHPATFFFCIIKQLFTSASSSKFLFSIIKQLFISLGDFQNITKQLTIHQASYNSPSNLQIITQHTIHYASYNSPSNLQFTKQFKVHQAIYNLPSVIQFTKQLTIHQATFIIINQPIASSIFFPLHRLASFLFPLFYYYSHSFLNT